MLKNILINSALELEYDFPEDEVATDYDDDATEL